MFNTTTQKSTIFSVTASKNVISGCSLILAAILLGSSLLGGCSSHKTKSDPYENMTAEKIYNKGKAAALKGSYHTAIKDFEELEARYPYGHFTDKAQLALIHAYFKNNNAASALAIADRFIRVHPSHEHVDYAYYLKGLVNYEENFSSIYHYFPIDRSLRDPSIAQQAFDDFKTLLQKFPNSKYAADARQRMVHLRNQFANYELHVANYYMTQNAYLAASNRAGYILNYFDQTEAIPEALILMVKAYRAMGMQELEADAFATLQHNFPERSAEL